MTTGMENKKIGFIGTGKMGEALIKGLLYARLVSPENIFASDVDFAKLQLLEKDYKISICRDNCAAVVDSRRG